MATESRFVIRNDLARPIILNVEPECAQLPLASGEHVTVRDAFEEAPLTLHVAADGGETIISVWPGDGDVRVDKDGVDVLDLVQRSAPKAPASTATSSIAFPVRTRPAKLG